MDSADVAAADCPFIALFFEQSSRQPQQGLPAGKDTDHIAARGLAPTSTSSRDPR